MTHHEQDEQTEHPKPRDRSHHDETGAGQPAENLPDGSGTNTGANDDTAEDTASGGPAD